MTELYEGASFIYKTSTEISFPIGVKRILIECYGGKGVDHPYKQVLGGKGGYSKGEVNLENNQILYAMINSDYGSVGTNRRNYGGGSTDVRLRINDLSSRIIVAGGGGGAPPHDNAPQYQYGGHGGGLVGGQGLSISISAGGGSQVEGGRANGTHAENGGFGVGGRTWSHGGGGGGGWYGGAGGGNHSNGYSSGGGGGSSYIGGVENGETISGISDEQKIVVTILSYQHNKYLFKDGEEIKKYVLVKDNIPTMTSNTEPYGIASAVREHSSDMGAWRAFDDYSLADGNDNGKGWLDSGFNGSSWLEYDFGVEKIITKYTIVPQDQGANETIPSRAPVDWTFEGYNSSTASWDILDTKIGVVDWFRGARKEFTITNTLAYSRYRINITKNNGGGSYLAIGEIQMMEEGGFKMVGDNPATKTMFDEHGITDLSVIDIKFFQQIQSEQVELLCWTDEVGPSRHLGLTGIPKHGIAVGANDIELGDSEKITLSAKMGTGSLIRIGVSADKGLTWMGKTQIIIDDLSSVKANGFTPEELNALTKEQIATIFPNGTARFAFYLEQENISDVVEIHSLSVGEKQYTISPTATDLSLIYEVLQEEKPTLYASRDDGVSWKEISQDEMASLSEQPEGKSLRVKAALKNGQEIYAMSYAWS